jgi:hypothetical protein
MANVQISDLPFATIPLVGSTTFFEVEVTEGGVVVSRRVAADDLVISATTLFINGTSVDDPAIGGGVFDGQLLWRNVNLQQTGVFGFDPAGDNFIWSNDAEGGFHQIAIRDGTVLVETIAAAAGGLLANNLLTGAGLERVLTAADLFAGVVIGTSTDDPTNPAGGGTYDATLGYQNSLFAATGEAGFDPAGDTFRVFNKVRRGSFAVRVITGGGVEEDTYRYDGFAGSHTWLDVLNAGLIRMSVIAGNASVIMAGGVNPPSTGAGQTGNFRMTLQDGTETGEMGFGSSLIRTSLEIKNFVHGGPVSLSGEDGSGVEQLLFFADPDSNSTMLHAGEQRLFTVASGGVAVNAETADDPVLQLNENFIVQTTFTHDVGTDESIWENAQNGGSTIIRGRSDAGEVRDVIDIDYSSAGGFIIFSEPNGTQQLMRLDTGVNAVTQKANSTNQPSGGFAQVGVFRVVNRNASPETAMFVGFNETIGSTTLRLKNFVHGGPLELVGENAAGTERVLYFFDPDQVGPIITGILDNDPAVDASIQDARMTFRNPSADNIWQIGFLEGTNDFSIKLFQDTGVLQLRGSDAASVDTLMASFDPEGDVTFFRDAAGTSLQFLASNISGIIIRGGFAGLATITGEQADGTDLWKLGQNGSFMELESELDNSGIQFVTRDSSPVDHVAARFNPAGDAEIFHIGVSVVATLTAAAGGLSANNTLTGAGFERVLTTSDIPAAAALNDLTDVTLTAPATGSVLFKSAGDWLNTPAISIDPAGAVTIQHNTADRILTTTEGIDFLGETASAADYRFMSADGLTERARLGHDAGGTRLQSRVNSLGISLRVLNGAGVEQVVVSGSGSTGTSDIRWTGLIRLITASSGVTIRGNAATNVLLLMEGSTGVDHMAMRGESTRVIWDGLVDSSLLLIRGANSVSASVECATFDPDAEVQLKFAGATTLLTRLEGIRVRGDGADTGNITIEDTGVATVFHIDVVAGITQIRSFINGNVINIIGDDTGGTTRNLITMDPDGANSVELYEVGVSVARTTTAALGGLFANNTLTGAGYERVLTVADRRSAEIYTPTNVSTDRAYDANATSIDELADVLGTLIADLQAIDVIQ